ncbi:hypothetical protein RQP46_006268 [Phenoliferia psychrophenolica]
MGPKSPAQTLPSETLGAIARTAFHHLTPIERQNAKFVFGSVCPSRLRTVDIACLEDSFSILVLVSILAYDHKSLRSLRIGRHTDKTSPHLLLLLRVSRARVRLTHFSYDHIPSPNINTKQEDQKHIVPLLEELPYLEELEFGAVWATDRKLFAALRGLPKLKKLTNLLALFTSLKYLILGGNEEIPTEYFPDCIASLTTPCLESLSLEAGFASDIDILHAITKSTYLESLNRLRISYYSDEEEYDEESTRSSIRELCAKRGVALEIRYLSEEQLEDRTQWNWYTQNFDRI